MDEIFTGKWYPWYAAKALESEDFADLSLTEEGAYRRALDIAWKKGSLPANPAKFAAVIGKRCTERVAIKVLQLFDPMPGHSSRVVNNTLERIRKEQEEKHRKRVGAGSAGGRPKGSKNGGEQSIAKPMLKPMLSNASTDIDLEEDIEQEKKEEKSEEAVAETAPPAHTEQRIGDSHFDNPPVILFEEIFGFKTGSNFAKEVFRRVKDLAVWDNLLRDKIAYADRPLNERKKITNWILEEYEKRAKTSGNGRLQSVAEKLAGDEAQRNAPRPKPSDELRRVQGQGRTDSQTSNGGRPA